MSLDLETNQFAHRQTIVNETKGFSIGRQFIDEEKNICKINYYVDGFQQSLETPVKFTDRKMFTIKVNGKEVNVKPFKTFDDAMKHISRIMPQSKAWDKGVRVTSKMVQVPIKYSNDEARRIIEVEVGIDRHDFDLDNRGLEDENHYDGANGVWQQFNVGNY